jgi:hypothetical protein
MQTYFSSGNIEAVPCPGKNTFNDAPLPLERLAGKVQVKLCGKDMHGNSPDISAPVKH